MKKLIIFLVTILSFSCLVTTKTQAANEFAIQKNKDGRIKPISNADSLTKLQLDEVMKAMGMSKDFISNSSKEDKIKLAKEGGKSVKLRVKNIKKFYTSITGETIEYTEENLEKIKNQKLRDIELYKRKTGKNISIMELGDNKPFTFNSSNIKTNSYSLNSTVSNPTLPGPEVEENGSLTLNTYVIFKEQSGVNLIYEYYSGAYWSETPIFTIVEDALATAFDIGAKGSANSFQGSMATTSYLPDGNGGIRADFRTQKLDYDIESFSGYGHGVKIPLTGNDEHVISMSREVSVPLSSKGQLGEVITKYHHSHLDLDGVFGIAIGPLSITFPGSSGTDYSIEYEYKYGDVSPGDYYLDFGWNQTKDGWIYYTYDGKRYTGLLSDNGKFYYMNPASGIMQTGWVQMPEGYWLYFDPTSGVMQFGWKLINGSWYYLEPNTGVMLKGWQQINGYWYFLDRTTGAMKVNWQLIGGSWYYFDSSGKMKTGWFQENGYWYYLDPTSGFMRIGWQQIGGSRYYFYSSGKMAANTTVDGNKIGADGKML